LVIRLGKYNTFNTEDFLTGTPTDYDVLRFGIKHIMAPIDFCKITEYVDDTHYNMYAYKSPYESYNIPEHDNSNDEWSYYIPASKVAGYTNDILTGINSLFTTISRSKY